MWTNSTKRAHDNFIATCMVTKILTNLHSTKWRCDGSHWWSVIAQIPVYSKHYFRLYCCICAIPVRQNKNAFEFGWGIKIWYSTAYASFFFGISCMFHSILFRWFWKTDFHVCWCWSMLHRNISSCNCSLCEGCVWLSLLSIPSL